MALRNILTDDDPALTKKSRLVEKFDERLWQLLDDMADTMYEANGVGLAAPQVGILRRVTVIDVGEELLELINPEIALTEGEQEGSEGCLSSPGEYGLVIRPFKVTVNAQNRHGEKITIEGEELLARALCHEIDHLDGILFKERAEYMLDPDDVEVV